MAVRCQRSGIWDSSTVLAIWNLDWLLHKQESWKVDWLLYKQESWKVELAAIQAGKLEGGIGCYTSRRRAGCYTSRRCLVSGYLELLL